MKYLLVVTYDGTNFAGFQRQAKVEACHQAYNKFKDKLFNFTVD